VVICQERGADLHMAQLMSLPLTVSCLSKIQIGFTFLVPAHLGSPGKGLLNRCVCVTWFVGGASNSMGRPSHQRMPVANVGGLRQPYPPRFFHPNAAAGPRGPAPH